MSQPVEESSQTTWAGHSAEGRRRWQTFGSQTSERGATQTSTIPYNGSDLNPRWGSSHCLPLMGYLAFGLPSLAFGLPALLVLACLLGLRPSRFLAFGLPPLSLRCGSRLQTVGGRRIGRLRPGGRVRVDVSVAAFVCHLVIGSGSKKWFRSDRCARNGSGGTAPRYDHLVLDSGAVGHARHPSGACQPGCGTASNFKV